MKNTNTSAQRKARSILSVREVAANMGELLRKHGVIDAAAIDDPEGYDNYDMLGRLLRVAEEQARINESTPPATLPPVGATPEQLEESVGAGSGENRSIMNETNMNATPGSAGWYRRRAEEVRHNGKTVSQHNHFLSMAEILQSTTEAIQELKSIENENYKLAREWSEHGHIDTARMMIARARGCRDAINILTSMEKPI